MKTPLALVLIVLSTLPAYAEPRTQPTLDPRALLHALEEAFTTVADRRRDAVGDRGEGLLQGVEQGTRVERRLRPRLGVRRQRGPGNQEEGERRFHQRPRAMSLPGA